jgi:hypothetical protein
LRFQLVCHLAEIIDLFAEVIGNGFAFSGKIKVSAYVLDTARQLVVLGKSLFQPATLAHKLLRPGLIRPDRGVSNLLFNFG